MYYCRCQIMCKYFGNISQLETRLGRSLIWLVVLTVDLASQPIRHTSLEVPVGQKKNFRYHLSGVVVDPLGIHFLPSSAHIWLAIWPLYHRLSKKAGCLIYLGVRNENPKWKSSRSTTTTDEGGIESSFFWTTDVCRGLQLIYVS